MAEKIILKDPQAVVAEAATRWAKIAADAVKDRGRFTVALAGGQTPRLLYSLLAAEPYQSTLPWAQTFVFFTDERRVSPNHADSNYRMARETLLSHVPIPPENIFPMRGEGLGRDIEKTARYDLEDHFQIKAREWPRFDLILLGLGDDGHFASIFPGTRAVSDLSHPVLVYPVPSRSTERITLTLPVFNNARHLLFVVTGESKAAAVEQSFNGPDKYSTIPSKALKPVNGDLIWLLDEAAASSLTTR